MKLEVVASVVLIVLLVLVCEFLYLGNKSSGNIEERLRQIEEKLPKRGFHVLGHQPDEDCRRGAEDAHEPGE